MASAASIDFEVNGDDSYRVATETVIPDDNRTATGTIKSYRKTPYHSRAAGLDIDRNGAADFNAVNNLLEGPRDEHQLPLHELLTRYLTDASAGLSAPQVQANLELYGPNSIMTALEVPEWVRFLKCIFGGSSIILWTASVLCFTNYSIEAGQTDSPALDNVLLGITLIFVILLTGIFSFVQEHKGAKIAKEYEKLAPRVARVVRDYEEQEVDAEEVVMGDILVLKVGDVVSADCRIIESNGLMVDNSGLTGESDFVPLDVHTTHEQQIMSRNMAFFSTFVVRGSGRAVVTRTGINTIMGQVADLTAVNHKVDTLLTREISSFVHLMTAIGVSMAVLFFIIAFLIGYMWIDAILFLIGVIVANVPEGLMAVITFALSLSATRLRKRNCIVKNIEAVEGLGSVSIILTDKTGTLTKNMATVAHVWYDNVIGEVDTGATRGKPTVSFDTTSSTWKYLARIAVLCNGAEFTSADVVDSPIEREVSGNPIEAALLRLIESLEGNTGTFRSMHPVVCEIPYNPIIKFRLCISEAHDMQTNGYLLTMVGEPEAVLNRCGTALVNGQERRVDEDYKAAFRFACNELGGLGERLVALCDWRLPPKKYPPGFQFNANAINFPLSGFRMVGVVSLMDPPRASVPDAVAKCQSAGIKVIMVTGDHPATAKAVARSVGILSPDQDPQERTALTKPAQSCLITGEEVAEMTTDELDSALVHHQEVVLARFSAEQKLAVVMSCQRLGAVVAVTGDGANDAPALHKADVGVAMNNGGGAASGSSKSSTSSTDVAKQAADIILMDDNFASIVVAIEEGRIMFDNLQKCLFYVLASNIPEVAAFMLYLIAQVPLPLGALAVLCIDLGTDMLPAISLAFEEEEERYAAMRRGPRNPRNDSLLNEKLVFMSCGQVGLVAAAAGFFEYFVIMAENGFWPSKLLNYRILWDSKAINDLRDSYDQEWTYEDRKNLEYTCHAGFFFTVVTVQWVTLLIGRSRKKSVFQRGLENGVLNFALLFETALAFVLIYVPGLNTGLQFSALNPISWFPSIPFVIFLFGYDEIRKAIIRKHPGGLVERETCF